MSNVIDMHDGPDHLRPIEIPAAVLRRWIEQAEWIARVEPMLLIEMRGLEQDATPWRLQQCAKAARFAAELVDEPYRGSARALAVELEEMGGNRLG